MKRRKLLAAVFPLFSYCLLPKPWQCCFWLAWGKWTLWHFTPWNVAAHGITCKHCSLLPWRLMTKIQPSPTCLCQDYTQTGLSNFKMFSAIKAERLCSFLFSYPVLFCLLALTFNHIIKCTLLLSCLHRPDYIFNLGFIDIERFRLWKKASGAGKWKGKDDRLPFRTKRWLNM